MRNQPDLLATAPASRFPLTDFLCALIKMSPAERRAASPDRAAQRYGIRRDWAEYYIEQWRGIE